MAMSRKLSSLITESEELNKVMSRVDWELYTKDDADRLKARLAELKGKKEKLVKEREEEKKAHQMELERLVAENRDLDEKLRTKEKQIRFNTLQLRTIRKGYVKKREILKI